MIACITGRTIMSALIRLVLLCAQLTFIAATFQVPFRCYIWDTGCITTLAQGAVPAFAEGFPDIGTKPLDPMFIPSLRVDEGGFTGEITNLTITGYKNSIVKKSSIDVAQSLVSTAFYTDLTLRGLYKSKPEDAAVDMFMLIKNIDMDLKMPFEIIKNANDSDIMLFKSYTYTFEVKETECYLRDLYYQTFNNVVIFDSIRNWRLISIPFGRSFMDIYMDNIYTALRTYMLSEPLRNIIEY